MVYLAGGKRIREVKQRIALGKTDFSKKYTCSLQKRFILISRRYSLKHMFEES